MQTEQKDKVIKLLTQLRDQIGLVDEQIDIPNVSPALRCARVDIVTAIQLIKTDGKKWGEE